MTPRSARTLLAVPHERLLAPVTATFFVFGIFWGGWAVSTAEFERALHVGTAGFGGVLSAALLLAAVGNAAGGPACERWGAGPVLAVALVGWSALLVVGALVRHPLVEGLVLVAVIGTGGLVDVAMNVAATAVLSSTPGFLVRFHGRFNFGSAAGGAAAGALISVGAGWRWLWAAIAFLGLALAAWCRLARLPASSPGESVPLTSALAVLRREGLVLLAVAFSVSALAEGGIDLWGVLYLRTRLDSGLLVGAGGAVLAYLFAGSARFLLGERAGWGGAGRGISLGAGAAAAGAVLMAATSRPVVAACGLVLAAGGISMCWPLFLAEGAAGRERPGAGVGAMSAVGYLGLVAGPAVVGLVADVVGLRGGLAFLGLAAAFVAASPRLRRSSGDRPST